MDCPLDSMESAVRLFNTSMASFFLYILLFTSNILSALCIRAAVTKSRFQDIDFFCSPFQMDTQGPVMLDHNSSPAEVRAWLEYKGFSRM